MAGYDLIVVGAGIVGAACADCASAEGLKVAVIEAGAAGGGVTAAGMGHLVAVDGLSAELALARFSLGLWEALKDLPGAEFSRCGTLWIAGDEHERAGIPDKLARLRASGAKAEAVDATQLRELEPALAPGLAGGVLVPDEAVVYAPAVARRLLERACQRGATLLHARAVALGDHAVTLDDGSVLHGAVLIATGAALPELLPELPLRLHKGHLVITQRYPGTVRHQLVHMGYTDSAHGETDSVAFNVQPRPTGQLLIGSSREYGSAGTEVSLPMLRRMLQRAFAFLPALRQLQALRAWAGLRPASIDGAPYIGRVAGRRGIWVAAGHEGLGVTTAPGTARLLVDQLLGRPTSIDARPYDPARVAA
ncbi:MAG: D-amino-acid oxidase [Rhodanobacteraceae bacterium]|jgi:glycine/D-amino acid oxidase-like deaminating enzyme|nr:MAG: D-amino-acid oxidase [Rhodanobacteraceae bacterium]